LQPTQKAARLKSGVSERRVGRATLIPTKCLNQSKLSEQTISNNPETLFQAESKFSNYVNPDLDKKLKKGHWVYTLWLFSFPRLCYNAVKLSIGVQTFRFGNV